ncbi:MAG: hypothetical protein E7388_04685 [Ruminococcaceae bacterium]|nr:hypothetical protein [Oscillospiraceae bacterium]
MRCIKLLSEDKELTRYFTCKVCRVDEEHNGFMCYVERENIESFCEMLSDYIWNNQIKKFLCSYTRKNVLLTAEENMEIAAKALSIAMGIKDGCDVIKEKLYEIFVQKCQWMSLEGFVRFRLRELKKDLCSLADLCADELIAKREYEDFIELLKSFVELQKPSKEPVYIKVERDGTHKLLDTKGKEILSPEEKSAGIAPDDLLLSALVSCSPGKIFLFNEKYSKNPQILDTIKSIFTGRVFSVSEEFSFPASPGFWQ